MKFTKFHNSGKSLVPHADPIYAVSLLNTVPMLSVFCSLAMVTCFAYISWPSLAMVTNFSSCLGHEHGARAQPCHKKSVEF